MKDGHFSKYWKPAACWQEALPIGSGDIGVMVFGGVKKERLALNHDEIWGPRYGYRICRKQKI